MRSTIFEPDPLARVQGAEFGRKPAPVGQHTNHKFYLKLESRNICFHMLCVARLAALLHPSEPSAAGRMGAGKTFRPWCDGPVSVSAGPAADNTIGSGSVRDRSDILRSENSSGRGPGEAGNGFRSFSELMFAISDLLRTDLILALFSGRIGSV